MAEQTGCIGCGRLCRQGIAVLLEALEPEPTAGGRIEVRSYEVPFVIEHGQVVGRLTYERLTSAPHRLYGQGHQSNYQRQGIALSKHFKPPARAL